MQKYVKSFSLSALHTFQNKKALVGLSIFLVICLLIFSNLWKIIAARTGALHLDSTELLWYIALNEWVLIAIPRPEREIQSDLRSGKLACLLPKPIHYLGSVFSESLGAYSVNLLGLGLVAFSFTWIQVGPPPVPLWVLPILLLTGFMGGILGILFQMLIGVGAFWIHEVESFTWIWEKLLFALGGLILPLSVYPSIWQTISKYTPFPYILGGRSSQVMDYSIAHIGSILAFSLIWIFIGLVFLTLLFRKGLKILNMEGG